MKKYIAEFVGTFLLILIGCGVASITGGSLVPTSLAFGFSLLVLSYVIGPISSCHLNPAVSLMMYLTKKLELDDFIGYLIAQIFGAVFGALILGLLLGSFDTLATNGFALSGFLADSMWNALLVEIILSFLFLSVILKISSNKNFQSISGIILGLALVLVNLFGIPFTGAGINPVRSFAPALLHGGKALGQVWVFLVAPFVGALLAVIFDQFLSSEDH